MASTKPLYRPALREGIALLWLATLLLLGLVSAALIIWYALPAMPNAEQRVGQLEEFSITETPVQVLTPDGTTVWLVQQPDGLNLFSAINPGRQEQPDQWRCTLSWQAHEQRFIDPCSGDKFGLDGRPLTTPTWVNFSDRSLDSYAIIQRGESLYLGELIMGEPATVARERFCQQWERVCK